MKITSPSRASLRRRASSPHMNSPLMAFVFAIKNIKHSCSVKIDHNKYINIRKKVKYLGNDLALKLPHIHAITGFDGISIMFSVGKVKVLKNA